MCANPKTQSQPAWHISVRETKRKAGMDVMGAPLNSWNGSELVEMGQLKEALDSCVISERGVPERILPWRRADHLQVCNVQLLMHEDKETGRRLLAR